MLTRDERFIAGMLAASVVLVLGGGIMIALTINDNAKFDAQYAENENKIAALTQEIQDIQNTEVATAEEVTSSIHSAYEAGEAVARLQNQYMSDSLTDAQLEATSSELDSYLADDSKNFRTPWFTGNGTWRFMSTFTFTQDTMDVLWECTGSNKLYAYATGTYDSAQNRFTNIKVVTTSAGNESIAPTGETDAKQYDEMIDSIRNEVNAQ